jgi:hypothetical protein
MLGLRAPGGLGRPMAARVGAGGPVLAGGMSGRHSGGRAPSAREACASPTRLPFAMCWITAARRAASARRRSVGRSGASDNTPPGVPRSVSAPAVRAHAQTGIETGRRLQSPRCAALAPRHHSPAPPIGGDAGGSQVRNATLRGPWSLREAGLTPRPEPARARGCQIVTTPPSMSNVCPVM